MKKQISMIISASVLCTGLALSGCDKSTAETSEEQQTTAVTTEQSSEEHTEEQNEEETSASETQETLYCEITGTRWDFVDDDSDDNAFVSNTTLFQLQLEFTDDSDRSQTSYTIERDGEVIHKQEGYVYYIGFGDEQGIHTNEYGYIPEGEYTVRVYNGGQQILEKKITVEFDAATAEPLPIITHNLEDEYASAYHYTSADHSQMALEYDAGCPGIYVEYSPHAVYESGTHKIEWYLNGEYMDTIEIEFSNFDVINASFDIEMPDGSAMPEGVIDINYYYDGELMKTDKITLK